MWVTVLYISNDTGSQYHNVTKDKVKKNDRELTFLFPRISMKLGISIFYVICEIHG